MSRKSDAQLGLAEYLAELQAELGKARLRAEGHDVNFSLDRVTVEVDVSYTLARSPGSSKTGKPEFWVVDPAVQGADDGDGSVRRHTQRLSVQLNQRPEATDVQPDDVATIPALPTAPVAKAE